MTFEVEHGDDAERTVVANADELDGVLDMLEIEARADIEGHWVHIFETSQGDVRKFLAIGIGRDYSFLHWVDETAHEGGKSLGVGDNETEWLYQGEPSTVDAGSLISSEAAREAARLFITTGAKPTNVEWKD